jgi:hypothetical protein
MFRLFLFSLITENCVYFQFQFSSCMIRCIFIHVKCRNRQELCTCICTMYHVCHPGKSRQAYNCAILIFYMLWMQDVSGDDATLVDQFSGGMYVFDGIHDALV